MPPAPDIPRLLMKLLAELMDRAEGVLLNTSIISADGVLLATIANDSSQIERVAGMITAMAALSESMCDAAHRSPTDSWDMKFGGQNPDNKVLGWTIYPRKWGSLAAGIAGPARISDFQAGIFYKELPRALQYIDQLFETQQEPPPVKWAINVVVDGDDPHPDEPGPTILKRHKPPDEE